MKTKILANAGPYLDGETPQAIAVTQTTVSPWIRLLTYLFMFIVKHRAVIATQSSIVILDLTTWMWKPNGRLEKLPLAVPVELTRLSMTIGDYPEKLFIEIGSGDGAKRIAALAANARGGAQ